MFLSAQLFQKKRLSYRVEDRAVDNFLNSSINSSAYSQKVKERRALSNEGAGIVTGTSELPKVRNGRHKPQTSQPPPGAAQI